MNILVTHRSVDLDAITSCWLIKRFLPGWNEAEIKFVDAGSTLDNKPPDDIFNIIHVDTGLGKFDHHQTDTHTSAAQRTYEFLKAENHIQIKYLKALEKLSLIVTQLDHFEEAYFPEAANDRYDFMLHQIIEGLKGPLGDDTKIMEMAFILLDAIVQVLRNKAKAEEAIKNGFIFQSKYDKCIVMDSQNEESIKLALKSGYSLAAKKDPVKGNVRIKTLPDNKYDLTPVYAEILKKDKKGTWFLHISKHMLLNSSSKNPNFIPSPLSLKSLIEIIKSV